MAGWTDGEYMTSWGNVHGLMTQGSVSSSEFSVSLCEPPALVPQYLSRPLKSAGGLGWISSL